MLSVLTDILRKIYNSYYFKSIYCVGGTRSTLKHLKLTRQFQFFEQRYSRCSYTSVLASPLTIAETASQWFLYSESY